MVPVKYTTEVNFNLESPIKRFSESIDLQVLLLLRDKNIRLFYYNWLRKY